METRPIGIILNGVTGRMGMNQHLERSIMAIRQQGGVKAGPGIRIMPEPILVGRNAEKLKALSQRHGGIPYSTDLDSLLGDPKYSIYFDAQTTPLRFEAVSKALAAGKHVYCEKPVATTSAEAMELVRRAEKAGVKNGVVQDKLWLPGIRKLKHLIDTGILRQNSVRARGIRILGFHRRRPAAPSGRVGITAAEDGGGIIIDMLCHWRYLIDNLFGNVISVSCLGATHIAHRDRRGRPTIRVHRRRFSAYATFELTERNIVCHFNSSWCVRVRRDDLLTLQVDGTNGSAVAGLRECWMQPTPHTPAAGLESRHRQPDRFFRRLAKRAGGSAVRQRLQGAVGVVPAPCGAGRAVPLDACARRPRACNWRNWESNRWKQRRWIDVAELR